VIRSVTVTPTVGTPTAITVSAGTEPTCQLTNGTTTTTYATTATNNTGFNWSLSNAAAGSINASTGVMTWANGFAGSVNIQVTANGCNGPSAQVIRSVTVTPTVGTPTAITVSAGTEPTCQLTNGTTTTTYATTATNNTGFNWSLSNAAAGSINASTGVMTWANGFAGSVNIQVTANGCNGPSAQVIRSVTVTPTVGTPVFSLGAATTRCQGAGSVTYSATATNSTTLTYSLDAASLSGGNTIVSGTGVVTFAAGWSGTSLITATATGCNGPTSSVHTVTITPTVGTPVFAWGATSSRCRGAATVTYVATSTNNTGITYSLDASSLAGGNTIVAASGAVTYASTWSGTTLITATATGCNGPASSVHTVTTIGDETWTGTISTDWNQGGNWSCGYIPDLLSSVQIPNVANKPVLSGGAVGQAKNVTIDSGSSLTVSANTLQIGGSISNSGQFNAIAGTIEMKGSAAQTIPANLFSTNTINNLIVNNPQNVSLAGALKVSSTVLVNSGNLISNGYLTLLSTASQTALIDGSGNGQVSGDVTMQRYLTNGAGYKYLGSPFSDATADQLASYLSTTATIETFFRYDENHKHLGEDQSGWVAYPSGSLNVMEGYAANLGAGTPVNPIQLHGTVNNGSLSASLLNHNGTYTQGFHLVGNPYPSPVNWDLIHALSTNIDAAIYFFESSGDEYSGSYSSYVAGVSTGPLSNIIPSMQGFFMRVSDGAYPVSGMLAMNNGVRTNDLNPIFKAASVDSRIILRFAASFPDKKTKADPFVIYFDPTSSMKFDKEADALKMQNTNPSIPNLYGITSDKRDLSISAIPEPTDPETTLPLGISADTDGKMRIEATDISQLPSNLKLYLYDKQNGTAQLLTEQSVYDVSINKGVINDRFVLIFRISDKNIPTPQNGGHLEITRTGGEVFARVKLEDQEQGVLEVLNVLGQKLLTQPVFGEQSINLSSRLSSGVFVVTLRTGNTVESEKTILRK
ncbi:MAG: T9SS type A sorting domain-containing protein, partial [Marinilabiliales bacterium]|nr:T9SS type A sorting domain-containing protein [Marinilabiliales bacterium]